MPSEMCDELEGGGTVLVRLAYTKLDSTKLDEARDFYNGEEVPG